MPETQTTEVVHEVNRLVLTDPNDPNVRFELYVEDGQLKTRKAVTTFNETPITTIS